MTPTELELKLVEAGWRRHPDVLGKAVLTHRLPGFAIPCRHNERPPVARVGWPRDELGVGPRVVSVEVVGEIDRIWFKLEAYSLTPDEFWARKDDVLSDLLRAWNALEP